MDNNIPVMIENLEYGYEDRNVLNGVSCMFEKGKVYGIIGPNGSGKTTLLKNMCALLKSQSQKVFIYGRDIIEMETKEIARTISVVPQNTAIDFDFTIEDIVLMGRSPYIKRMQGVSQKDADMAGNAMKTCGIFHLKDRSIHRISGGELQRVILARALAQDTSILLMDEPVSQLDIHHQLSIMETTRKLSQEKDITTVIVLHDLNLASAYCDTIYLMKSGKIFSYGSPKEVLTYENVESVYGIVCLVYENPVNGKPHIIPVECIKN